MPLDDLRLISKFSTDFQVDSQPAVTKKPTLWQQVKSALGLFSPKEIIQELHKNRADAPPSTAEYTFSHLKSLEPQANTSDQIKVLKAQCKMAQSISKACLKKPEKMQVDGRQHTTAVFQQVDARAKQVEQQLVRMERVIELKKQNPELAAKMEQAYMDNNNHVGDQIYAASNHPKIASFLTHPAVNKEFLNEVFKDKNFFNNMMSLMLNKGTEGLGMHLINEVTKEVAKGSAKNLEPTKQHASDQLKLLDMVGKWDGTGKVQKEKINMKMKTVPVVVKGKTIGVEKDNFDKRFGAVEIYAGEKVVHGGDPRWVTEKTTEEKEKAVGKMHEVLHEALGSTGLTEDQQLRFTTDMIKLSSINGLANVGNLRKMEFLNSIGGLEGMTLTSGLKPSSRTTVTLEKDGTVVVKAPPIVEQLRVDPNAKMPSFYGVRVEARISLEDYKKEPPLDPLPWSIESRVTTLHSSEAELMREFA